MANQAAKKRMQNAQSMSRNLLIAISIVNIIYLVFRFGMNAEYETFSSYQWAGFALHIVVSAMMYNSIIEAEKTGLSYNYSFDTIAINLVVQLGSVYSEWFWVLYLAIPAFAFYKLGKLAMGYFFQAEPEPTPAETKAALKKARQAERARRLGGTVR